MFYNITLHQNASSSACSTTPLRTTEVKLRTPLQTAQANARGVDPGCDEESAQPHQSRLLRVPCRDDRAHLRSPATECAWTIAWYAAIVGVCSSGKFASLGSAASESGGLDLLERCEGVAVELFSFRGPAAAHQDVSCSAHVHGHETPHLPGNPAGAPSR